MGIAEFNEVGNIVHEFASEDAIIKIGTAIDPNLDDEIKVTVVATGMGLPPVQAKATVKSMQTNTGAINYDEFDKPTSTRQSRQENREGRTLNQPKGDLDYLDIPAFLRRQAD